MRSRLIFALSLAALLLVAVVPAKAGNKALVEQRVQELDDLNKQAVSQIKELPSDGQVDLKAHVVVRNGASDIEILEKKVTEKTTVKEEPIDFKAGNVTLPTARETIPKEHPDEQRPN